MQGFDINKNIVGDDVLDIIYKAFENSADIWSNNFILESFNTTPSKADVALQRSASLRQKPPRPPRPDELPPRISSRRPSIKSVSSDSFVQTLSSRRASIATSDPGSIFQERSKDDLDGQRGRYRAHLRTIRQGRARCCAPSSARSRTWTRPRSLRELTCSGPQ